MVLFIVALMVLVAVGVLLWKAVAAQTLATGSRSAEDDAPTGPTRPPVGGRSRRPHPVAPDDDPEFLRSLDDKMRRTDRDDPPSV